MKNRNSDLKTKEHSGFSVGDLARPSAPEGLRKLVFRCIEEPYRPLKHESPEI